MIHPAIPTMRRTRCVPFFVLLLTAWLLAAWPQDVHAHAAENAQHWWSTDPWVWIPMLAVTLLHARGIMLLRAKKSPLRAARRTAIASFICGMAALFFALIWPLDVLGAVSSAAHMAQHMLLIVVAAPLLVLAQPGLPLLAALPAAWRRANARALPLHRAMHLLQRPRVAFAVHAFMIWVWHAPLPYAWALDNEWVHATEHIMFLGSALLFWNALRLAGKPGGDGYGSAALWTLATLMHTGLLGALLTFAPRVLYSTYLDQHGLSLTPLEDQQLAGLLMWIPGGFCYLIAGLAFAAAWFRDAGAPAPAGFELQPPAASPSSPGHVHNVHSP